MDIKQTIRKLANIAAYTSTGMLLGGIVVVIMGSTSLGSVLVLLGIYSLPITTVLVVLSALAGVGVPRVVAGLLGFLGATSFALARGVGHGLANVESGDDDEDRQKPISGIAYDWESGEYVDYGMWDEHDPMLDIER